MTKELSGNVSDKDNNVDKYYIIYCPSTVQLMEKIGVNNFTMIDVVEYLTGKKLETCDERKLHRISDLEQ